jgi:hypothetical protein
LEEARCIQGVGGENLKESGYLKDLGVDGRIILIFDLQKWYGCIDWIDQIHYTYRWRGGSFECGNEHQGSTKRGEFLQ